MVRQLIKGILFFVFCCGSFASIDAKDFYAILVADTLEDSIGISCHQDLQKMREFVEQSAQQSDMHLRLVMLSGGSTITKHLKNVVHALPITQDDVVVFFFAGHGYRTHSKKDKFPNLYIAISTTLPQ